MHAHIHTNTHTYAFLYTRHALRDSKFGVIPMSISGRDSGGHLQPPRGAA